MLPLRIVAAATLLAALSVALPARVRAQEGSQRAGLSVAAAAGTIRATGAGTRAHGALLVRYALAGSPLVLRADGGTGPRAFDPNVATVALGLRVLDARGASAYLLGGGGWYSGIHATRGGRNAGAGVEVRPALLRGRALFAEGRAHAYRYSDLEGEHTARLTTVVAGLWW